MKNVIFNLHDITLLLIIAECLYFSLLLFRKKREGEPHHWLLMGFLIVTGLVALDTLLFWNEPIRNQMFSISPYYLLVLGFTVFLIGPAMYWYTLSLLKQRFSFSFCDGLHLLPSLLMLFYPLFALKSRTLLEQQELLLRFQIFDAPHLYFSVITTLKKLSVLIYGAVCLSIIYFDKNRGQINVSLLPKKGIVNAVILSGGMLTVWAWGLATHVVGLNGATVTADKMGVFNNYIWLLSITLIVTYNISFLQKQKNEKIIQKLKPSLNIDDDLRDIDTIVNAMNQKKLYLNSRLTLDIFAEQISLPSKKVSQRLNQHFSQTFSEFINNYRIREAKRILKESCSKELAITDIAVNSGFNSKATFNRVFKKITDVTPTEFRRRHES